MKHQEFLNQTVQVQKQIGKNRSGYTQTATLATATIGICTEVTKDYVQVERLDGTKINFLKRNGYFDYRGGRYQISLK